MPQTKQLLIATTNLGKLQEYQEIFEGLGLPLQLVSLKDIAIEAEAKETGDSFEANAVEKVIFYLNLSNLPVLADDGGLEIDYLNGRPGVKSRRWPGHKASDEKLISYTLEKLKGIPVSERGVQLRVVVALAFPGDNETYTFEGVLRGTIAKKPIEKRIQGYPFRSIFIPKQSKEYLGEMSLVAHRKEAIEKAMPVIREHLFLLEDTR